MNLIERMKTRNPTAKECTCYGQYLFNGHVQENYESSSRDARIRAKQLRDAGFSPVLVSPMGPQVTSVGTVRMTMITAYGNLDNLPAVKLERL